MKQFVGFVGVFLAIMLLNPHTSMAKPSKCEECHVKITPGIVKDFNRGKMSKTLTCKSCHGSSHTSAADTD